MELEWYHYLLLLLGGLAAGITNTLAGSGTVFTLSCLLLLGVPPTIANCTNRLGVLFQNLMGIFSFKKHGQFDLAHTKKRFLWATLVGALAGAYAAVELPETLLETIIGIVMVMMLFILIYDPKKRLSKKGIHLSEGHLLRDIIVFLLIGFYGGLIQVGIGIFMVIGLTLFSEMNMLQANAYKLYVILIYTVPTLAYMIYQDQVIWLPGSILAIGQIIGAYLAGYFAGNNPNAQVWVKRLLVVMILVTIVKTFWF